MTPDVPTPMASESAAVTPAFASVPSTQAVAAPVVSLPKGGGALRGIGETVTTNPVTGTGALAVPLAVTPGRRGFGPQLTLTYDSGAGNGPFGFGWSLGLPAIARKTDQGLPRYDDTDVFVLAGADDLVPVLDGAGRIRDDTTTDPDYVIRRYRPRIEGAFSRVERWTDAEGATHWRTLSRDNVLTVFGGSDASRVADPIDGRRVFSWLISETRDDLGGVIRYDYAGEDGAGLDLTRASEQHRGDRDDPRRRVNRYPSRIRYGNRRPVLTAAGRRPRHLTDVAPALLSDDAWLFEVVFDYGGHDDDPSPAPSRPWPVRSDPFSSYRAGFEVRTARRCRRVLMFHHIPDQAGGVAGYDGLVRSTSFDYLDEGTDAGPGPTAAYSLLATVTQCGHRRRPGGGVDSADLPPLQLTYSQPTVHDVVERVDPADLDGLPDGIDGTVYSWVDLDGDGVPGVFSEQGAGWFYSRALAPLAGVVRFAAPVAATARPTATLTRDGGRFVDLAGDGLPDLAVLEGPDAGFFERDGEGGWSPFRTFAQQPRGPLPRSAALMLDLDGDGRADLLVADAQGWGWYPSLGEEGWGERRPVALSLDDEDGPPVVRSGTAESLQVADLSGDGLPDLVRLRNGEVCYWPNLGHGRFGAKVTMDDAPVFDHPESFDAARLRLADLDGSGTADLVYLHPDGVRLYANLCGDAWGGPTVLTARPTVSDQAAIAVTDLLGNGTACLAWSGTSPHDGRPLVEYLRLMGADKPHLLVGVDNNLGAVTRLRYRPSTYFSLADRARGSAWRTRLPFPVHVVDRVETQDLVSRSVFTRRFAYHDGYFDGREREFRGFGVVDEWDAAEFAVRPHTAGHGAPARRTRTWYDTGAPGSPLAGHGHLAPFTEPGRSRAELDAERIGAPTMPAELDGDELAEARRALKGMALRQEVYGEDDTPAAHTPAVVTEHGFDVRALQRRGPNRHAVLHVVPRETLVATTERDPHDPRIRHDLVLAVDPYGLPTHTAAIAYGRRATTVTALDPDGRGVTGPNPALADLAPGDRDVQLRTLAALTEVRTTNAVDDVAQRPDDLRLPLACDTLVTELVGFGPTGSGGRFQHTDLVTTTAAGPVPVGGQPVEAVAGAGPARQLVGRVVTAYLADDLGGLLPHGRLESRALPGEAYRLALTGTMLDAFVMPDGTALLPDPDAVLGQAGPGGGGYVATAALRADGRLDDPADDGGWWVPTGRLGYADSADPAAQRAGAEAHFFTPRRYRGPFGHDEVVDYDEHDLVVLATRDEIGDIAVVESVDYRTLQPERLRDANGSRSAVAFDVLGLIAATAVLGRPGPVPEGDLLPAVAELTADDYDAFHDVADPHDVAAELLGTASTRVLCDVHRFRRTRGAAPGDPDAWQPAFTATVVREQHVADLAADERSPVQVEVSYSNGSAQVVQRKLQAEPGPVVDGGPVVSPRWVGTAWVVRDDKGNPIRTFEPFFSRATPGQRFEFAAAYGVAAVTFYDAADRPVCALNPDHSYTKVRRGAWRTDTWDVNDTSGTDPRVDPDVASLAAPYLAALGGIWRTWAEPRLAGELGEAAKAAATQAAAHAGTPTAVHLDPLGRPVVTVLHNRIAEPGHPDDGLDVPIPHRAELDVQGHRLTVRDGITSGRDAVGAPRDDPRGRLIAAVVYDLLGHPVRDASLDAGTRWTLVDATGATIRRWDSRGHRFRTSFDARRRSTHVHVQGTDAASPGAEALVERTVYGERHPEAAARNLCGRVFLHLDQAGVLVTDEVDLGGNPVSTARRLTSGTGYRGAVDWAGVDAALAAAPAPLNLAAIDAFLADRVDAEAFTVQSAYDALNRMTTSTLPAAAGVAASTVRQRYSEANLLVGVDLRLHGSEAGGQPSWTPILTGAEHDAKGQRLSTSRGNGAVTRYAYDPDTFRLTRMRTARAAAFGDAPDPAPANWPGAGLQDLHFAYDPVGNVVRIDDASQQRVFFANRRVDPTRTYAYDATYQLIRETGREHLGQAASPAAWSATDEPRTGVEWAANDGTALAGYTDQFCYDEAGNPLRAKHISTMPGRSWTQDATYDAPTVELDGGIRWSSNRLTRTAVAGQPPAAPDYDAHGNTVRLGHLGDGSPAPNLHWDAWNRLVRVDHGGGGTTYYVYDAAGRRVRAVREKPGAIVEERIAIGDTEVLRRSTGASMLERETLHVRDGANRIAMVETCTRDDAGGDPAPAQLVRYPLADHQGSSRVELDDQARILNYEEYSAFGATTLQAVSAQLQTPKRYRYTGRERDDETGFYAIGERYYVPWLARWLSCDPAGITDSPNRYEYVANNPVRHIDPTGRGLFDVAKAYVADKVDRAAAAVKPNGVVFEAVDSAFRPSEHPVSAAVLNNMAKRGEDLVTGLHAQLKQAGEDFGDIAYHGTHTSEPGSKEKLNAAVGRRAIAGPMMAVGMVKGFAHQLKTVGNALGDVAYYRPEFLGLGGLLLTGHAHEPGADAKVASAITDIVLDGPQIVLTVEGGINMAKGAAGMVGRPRGGGTGGVGGTGGGVPLEAPTPRTYDAAVEFGQQQALDGKSLAIGRYPDNVNHVAANPATTYTIDVPGWTPNWNAGVIRGHLEAGGSVVVTPRRTGGFPEVEIEGTFQKELEQIYRIPEWTGPDSFSPGTRPPRGW